MLIQKSLVENHISKMEKFGGKNHVAQDNIEGIKKKDEEMKRQIVLISERIKVLEAEKAKGENRMFDFAYVKAEIVAPQSDVHMKISELISKQEAIGEALTVINKGNKDESAANLKESLKKIRQLNGKQFKALYKQRKLQSYLNMNP